MLFSQSFPLTPDSSSSLVETPPPSTHQSVQESPRNTVRSGERSAIPLIVSLFPYHASFIATMSHVLEIVTPPDHVLQGFILDHPGHGRTVYVHLPPPHSASHRPETLSANFSEVLRPYDPTVSPRSDQPTNLDAFDIRESLTALLDLSSDSLEAKGLVLVLDKDDRGTEGLDELLHSLMYVGGQVVKPGGLEGGWEWDTRRWVLVGLEL